MTRKYLGIDGARTIQWLVSCKNCIYCQNYAAIAFDDPLGAYWDGLREHIQDIHIAEEYCLTCHIWVEDVEFGDHLWTQHHTRWTGLTQRGK